MIYVNIGVAIVAALAVMLVLRGTLYHLFSKGGPRLRLGEYRPGEWMLLGIGLYHVKALVRIVRWDIYAPIYGMMHVEGYDRTISTMAWNTGFSVLAIAGSIAVIWALYQNIPKPKREKYRIFGLPILAPWYPGDPPFFRKRGEK